MRRLVLLAVLAAVVRTAEPTRARHRTLSRRQQQVLSTRTWEDLEDPASSGGEETGEGAGGAGGEEGSATTAGAPTTLTDVVVNKHMVVNGTLNVNNLVAKNVTVVGDATAKVLTTSRVRATLVSADVVEAGILRSPTGTITIDGNLALDGGLRASPEGDDAFLETASFLASDVIVNGVRQWRLVFHDDFESQSVADAWDFGEGVPSSRGTCGNGGDDSGSSDHFLGGHCSPATAQRNATRIFGELPEHTRLRLKARVHFLDAWRGESVFTKIDSSFVWSDSAGSRPTNGDSSTQSLGLNICGGEHADMKFSAPVDVIVQHSGPTARVSFGSTLRQSIDGCDASWAVDDVLVYIR